METRRTIDDSRIVVLLKVLNNKEIRSLSDFVSSPFFNKKQQVTQLFEYLKKRYPNLKKLYRPSIYSHIFPEKNHSDNTPLSDKQYAELRHVMSDLMKLVKQYLLYENQKKNEVRQNYQLADIFLSRGLGKYVPGLLNDAKKKHAQRPEGEPMHLHDKYMLSEVEVRYNIMLDSAMEIGMQEAIDNFHHHALAGRLRLYAAALSRQHTMPNTYNFLIEKELVEHLSSNDHTDAPLVDAYYRIFMLFRGKDIPKHYSRLRDILTEKSGYFPHSELRYLCILLFNFCNLQVNRGHMEYYPEKFEIYERTLPQGIWHYGGYILRNHFILAVRTAIATGNLDGAKSIIDHYSPDLPPRHRESFTYLAYIFLFFAEKKYIEAEDTLIKMSSNPPEGFYYGIYYRQLGIQIYLELSMNIKKGYSRLLGAEIENFKSYIGRALMSKRNKTLYSNFISIVDRIYNKRFGRVNMPSLKILQNIKDDITNPDEWLVEREWLLEKVEEVEAYWNKKR